MKKRIRIISISALFLIMISLAMIGITYGWLTHGIVFTSGNINVGDLRYTKSGTFITPDTIIVPGDNLIDQPFVINNLSPIASQLRVKITYTRITKVGEVITPEADYVFKNDTDDHLAVAVTFTSTFTFTDGDLILDEFDDDYWYFGSSDEIIPATSGDINLFSAIYYDGDKTSIDYNGQDVTVTVTVEVKQADNVTWSELTTYDFATGYPGS